MNFSKFKRQLVKDDKFNKFYTKKDIAFEIAEMIIDLRIKKGLTQEELAKKIGTKQSSVARLERGKALPSLSFLEKIAKACETELVPPSFSCLTKEPSIPIMLFGFTDNNKFNTENKYETLMVNNLQ